MAAVWKRLTCRKNEVRESGTGEVVREGESAETAGSAKEVRAHMNGEDLNQKGKTWGDRASCGRDRWDVRVREAERAAMLKRRPRTSVLGRLIMNAVSVTNETP